MSAWKIETHLHTVQGSACGVSTGAEMARAHKAAGYDAIIVTDHFFNGNTAVSKELPWTQRVYAFLEGYAQARAEGMRIGLDVYFGWEWAYSGTEFLTYGLTQEYLLDQPDMLTWDVETYLVHARAAGGLVSHAHPFRKADYIHTIRLYPTFVDAVEVYNASNAPDGSNEEACTYAMAHDLAMTAGSDAHNHEHLRGSGMLFDHPIKSFEEFLCAVRARERFTM